jgi:hypothetical protein
MCLIGGCDPNGLRPYSGGAPSDLARSPAETWTVWLHAVKYAGYAPLLVEDIPELQKCRENMLVVVKTPQFLEDQKLPVMGMTLDEWTGERRAKFKAWLDLLTAASTKTNRAMTMPIARRHSEEIRILRRSGGMKEHSPVG